MKIKTNDREVESKHDFAREMEGAKIFRVKLDGSDEVFNARLYVRMPDGSNRTYFISADQDRRGSFLAINARDDGWDTLEMLS